MIKKSIIVAENKELKKDFEELNDFYLEERVNRLNADIKKERAERIMLLSVIANIVLLILLIINQKGFMKIIYTGKFLEWLVWNIALTVLTIVTFGIASPYLFYWNKKYFFEHLEINDKKQKG